MRYRTTTGAVLELSRLPRQAIDAYLTSHPGPEPPRIAVPIFGGATEWLEDVDDLISWVTTTVGVNSMRFDIDDPYRRGSKVATATADAIDRALDAFLPVLAEAELPRLAREQRDPPKRRRRRFR